MPLKWLIYGNVMLMIALHIIETFWLLKPCRPLELLMWTYFWTLNLWLFGLTHKVKCEKVLWTCSLALLVEFDTRLGPYPWDWPEHMNTLHWTFGHRILDFFEHWNLDSFEYWNLWILNTVNIKKYFRHALWLTNIGPPPWGYNKDIGPPLGYSKEIEPTHEVGQSFQILYNEPLDIEHWTFLNIELWTPSIIESCELWTLWIFEFWILNIRILWTMWILNTLNIELWTLWNHRILNLSGLTYVIEFVSFDLCIELLLELRSLYWTIDFYVTCDYWYFCTNMIMITTSISV